MAKRATKKKATGKTAARIERQKARFLQALALNDGSVASAATAIGVARGTPYRWRDDDEAFRDAWWEVEESEIDTCEANVMRRAKRGWLKPVWHNGKRVGVERVIDNRLSTWVLERRRKKRYAQTQGGSEISPEEYAQRVHDAFEQMDMLTGGVE